MKKISLLLALLLLLVFASAAMADSAERLVSPPDQTTYMMDNPASPLTSFTGVVPSPQPPPPGGGEPKLFCKIKREGPFWVKYCVPI